jgi:hypothetical protein
LQTWWIDSTLDHIKLVVEVYRFLKKLMSDIAIFELVSSLIEISRAIDANGVTLHGLLKSDVPALANLEVTNLEGLGTRWV